MSTTATRGKAPERPFSAIYRDLAQYPSEEVTEAIEGQRLAKRSITTASTKEILDRRVQIVATLAEKPAQHDPAHLARIAALVTPNPDRLDEKIARCMKRKGISRREEMLYQCELKRHQIAGWGYHPDFNRYESECRCRDHESAPHHDVSALREEILSELTSL